MKISLLLPVALAVLAGAAHAADSDTPAATPAATATVPPAAPTIPKPGPEDKKLAIFMKSSTWTGKISGADSREISSHGKSTCRELFGGLAFHCEVQDTMGSGKTAFTWKGNMMTGFDRLTHTYKTVMVDSMGTVTSWTGTFPTDDGKKFVLLSDAELQLGSGPAFKDQLTWDLTGAKEVFTDDHIINGQTSNFETAEMKPAGSGTASAAAKR